jgi:hypothetical protein
MEKLFEQLIESAKKNRKGFNRLKNAVVTCEQFELASQLRNIEKEAFPETEEVKMAKEQAKKLNLAFRMVALNISEDVCWLIAETLKIHNEKQGNFSIDDAANLILKKEEIFLTEDN